ncbi:hypothetical protein QQS21_008511 [Conoideocrella luteorostrata]|uniref:Secreted protein n=1 Tax=Conoideocrella luteorostrata TaxID=1105319 RepID=A0AAJ0FWH6_9HYPO|nr:hypothetical protein QQS21_008511 [Conoideocrella luteorostrata]
MPAKPLFSAVLLALAAISPVAAAKCHVVGWMRDNNVWNPPGGIVRAGGQGLVFYRNDKEIHRWVQCDKCGGLCTDYKSVETPPLPKSFEWAASCDGAAKFSECHGAYGSQTHIDGDTPQNDGDFYGIGFTTMTQCHINFDCED